MSTQASTQPEPAVPPDAGEDRAADHADAPASHHAEPSVRPPRRRTLAIGGVIVMAAAVAAVVNGISARGETEKQLATWADKQAIPTVSVVQPEVNAMPRQITLPGTIQAFFTAPIYARVPGYIKAWNSDIGARVKKGQELAEIDTPDLDQQYAQAQANLSITVAADHLATLTAERWHQLLGYQTVSRQAEDEKISDALSKHAAMQAAQASLGQLQAMEQFKHIVAPFDGIVTARRTDVGDLVNAGSAGAPLFQISDVHKVRIYVEVPQALTSGLQPGLKASLAIPQYSDRTFDASLVTTSNAFSEASRTVTVQLQADNPDDKLWPGTFTEVSFHLPADTNVLRIPATALVFGAHGVQVAVLSTENKVQFRTVKLGRNLGNDAEVLAGLTPTDRIIDNPPEWLTNGDAVRVAERAPTLAREISQSGSKASN
jgi:RND family efflux transporter MFP subunit